MNLDRRRLSGFCAVLALLTLLAGCVTGERVDWKARVGHYQYDDAVKEFGPPDRKETLTDGTLVAQWVMAGRDLRTSPFHRWDAGYGPYGRRWRADFGPPIEVVPAELMLLEFGPDRQLVTAKRQFR